MVDRKGTKILYFKLQKVLYGLMRPEDYGFVINTYDPCVANMTTKTGKQLTVVWHVNNLMASCEDNFERENCMGPS